MFKKSSQILRLIRPIRRGGFVWLRPACLIVAGVVVLTAASWRTVAATLDEWQLLPRPERVTELYFVHPAKPIGRNAAGDYVVSFAVHNAEYRDTRYNYTVISSVPDRRLQVTHGSLLLAHNDRRQVERQLALPPLTQRTRVQVTLYYYAVLPGASTSAVQSQSIHHWI
jgi:hypothetical protein